MASDKGFQSKITDISNHIADLQKRSIESPERISETLSSALEELQVSLEELSAAEEELYQQNEELMAAEDERERYIQKVEEGQRILDSLMEYIPEGITIADAPGVVTRMTSRYGDALLTRGFEGTKGFTMDDWLRKVEHYLPDGITPAMPEDLPLWRAVKLGETVIGKELVLKRPNGVLVPVLCNAGPIRDKSGNVTGGVVAWRDITDIKKMEAGLRRQANLLDLANVLVRDIDDRIIMWNSGAEEMYGWSRQEALGKRSHDLLRTVFPVPLDEIKEELMTKGSWKGELSHMSKDGRRISVASQWVRALDDRGMPEILEVNNDITDLKKATDALTRSEERYRALFNGMTEGFALHEIICDENGKPYDYRFIEINPAFERLTGLKREDVIGRTHNEVLPGDDPHWVEAYGKVALTGEPAKFENFSPALKRHYGVFAYRTAPGQFAVLFMDITDRKKTEEKLSWLASFPQLNPSAIIEVSPEGDIRFLNMAAEQQFPDLRARRLDHPLLQGLESVASKFSLDKTGIQVRDVPMDGRWYQETMYSAPEPGGIRIYCLDITDRKNAEEVLAQTKDYLESLINYASAPIIVWDTSFRITRFNHAFERLTGLKAEDVLGKPLDILFPGDRRDESMASIMRTRSGERFEAVEIPVVGADRSARTVLWNSANIRSPDGSGIIATIAQGQDITERKRTEEALKEARDKLELRVKERTAELSTAKEELEVANEELKVELEQHEKLESELVYAKDMALEAAEAKSAFLANMSHELRTPLNSIIGFTSLLLDEDLSPEHRDYIESVRNGGEALLALINDILDFSRAEKDKVELEHQPLNLRALVDESLGMVAVQAEKKGLDLAYTIKYGTPEVIIGDQGRLRQILVNLLSNAVKFTDSGDISVSVSSKPLGERELMILFEVRDTGIGIPDDCQERLFQPFSQVERVISRKRDGVGLGLAISKALVELMGGKIWAQSSPGAGSVFRFTIRAQAAEGKEKVQKEMDMETAIECPPGNKPLRILIAEDNPSNQRVLLEMLKRMGYRADAVSDGLEVLQVMKLRPYDLILMDIKMPQMDGLEAARRIRAQWPEQNQPRIVAITAYAMEGDREMCMEAGMDDYISKPVQISKLCDILKRYSEA